MKKIFLIALILCCIVFVGCTEETIKEDNKVEVEETVTITEKNHNSYGRNCFLRYNDVEDFVYDLSMNYEDYFEVDYKRDESEYKKLLSEQEQKELFELNYFEEVALEYGDETADFLRGFLNKIKEVGVYYPKGKYLATIYQYDIDYSYEGIKEVYVKDMVKRIDVNRNPYNNIYGYKRILSPTIQYELNDPYCTGCFVEITITYLDESMKNADVITFCTRRKMQKRRTGIDQSELIAKRISLLTGIKCKKLLKRKGFIRKQHVLNYERRWKNVKNSFVALPFEEKTILLIDDICTTGATVNEAARTLKKAGAKRVYVLSFAH